MPIADISIPEAAKKIVSGVYTHVIAGEAQNIYERWTKYDMEDFLLVHVYYEREDTGIVAKVVIQSGQVTQFAYHIHQGETLIISGDYQLLPNSLHAVRYVPLNTKLEDHIPHDGNLLLDLPFIITKGYTIQALHESGQLPTFAPLLTKGERAGDLAKKTAQYHTDEQHTILAVVRELRHFEYGYDYWMDAANMVWRATSDAHQYLIVLTEYIVY